jgi:hypothetical protein
MTKQEWLQFIKDNEKEFKIALEDRDNLYDFAKKFKNLSMNYGATKYCLVDKQGDYVIKWDKDTSYGDTERECEVYQKAIEKGIAFLFPQTEILCRINGVAIVIQRKVDYCHGNMSYEQENKLNYQCRTVNMDMIIKVDHNIYRSRVPRLWIKSLICIYGKKITKLFEEFTHEQEINDLHSNNVGYLNGKPIVLDFSGYHH